MAIIFLFIALLSGAFAAFLQPLLGKVVLPLFGGSALTWNSTLLLFSGLIFVSAVMCVGFLQRFSQRVQAIFHMFVCLLCLVMVTQDGFVPHKSDAPVLIQMLALGINIFPFMLLSWGSVFLLYGWRPHHGVVGSRPLLIVATAFLGAALGLFSYHFLESIYPVSVLFAGVEKFLWIFTSVLFLTLLRVMWGKVDISWLEQQEHFEAREPYLSWIVIPFLTSFLLLGFTHLIGSEFTATPLMWIVPMGIFALSLFIAFLNPYLIPTNLFFVTMMLTSIPLMMLHVFGETVPTLPSLALHAAFFVSAVMLLHKELSLISGRIVRPHFFLCFTLGQFLAALFSVMAPFIFKDYIEYPLVMVGALGCAALFWRQEIAEVFTRRRHKIFLVLLPFLTMLCVGFLVVSMKDKLTTQQMLLLSAVMAASLAMLIRTPLLLSVGLAGLVIAPHLIISDKILFKDRSFYGISQVQDWHGFRLYTNGTTIHGAEPLLERRAVTYYTKEGPIGRFFQAKQNYTDAHPTAVLGLGVGCITTYMAPNQPLDFFEIDPLVAQVANTYFSYLKDSKSDIGIIMGDGRLEMEKVKGRQYGLIVLDAFSSDAIPTHLLTKEAFEIYLSKLRPDGIILTNITNRYLNLYPVLQAMAAEHGLALSRGFSTEENNAKLIFQTDWVALSRDPAQIEELNDQNIWYKDDLNNITHAVWKDDFVDIKSVFKK